MAPQSTSRLKVKSTVVRESWMAYDTLIANAFAPLETPSVTLTSTPTLHSMELQEPRSPTIMSPDGKSLEPIWDAVRELKSKALAALPSKVKSLEGIEPSLSPPPSVKAKSELPPPQADHRKLKRKSSATFKESADGRTVTAIFDMSGVSKQDMHVSFRVNRIVVTWRRVKIVETQEDGVLVRERKEKQYSQMMPLPEGTQFKEVRAARNGSFLMLTFPNLRCVKVDSVATSSTAWSSGETDFFTCEAGTMLDFEEFMVEKDLSADLSRRRTKNT